MKNIQIKLKETVMLSMDSFLDRYLILSNDLTWLEKCAYATLKEWQIGKLKRKLFYTTGKEHKFKLDASTSFAFIAFFDRFQWDPTTQLGNSILYITDMIDQHFSLPSSSLVPQVHGEGKTGGMTM